MIRLFPLAIIFLFSTLNILAQNAGADQNICLGSPLYLIGTNPTTGTWSTPTNANVNLSATVSGGASVTFNAIGSYSFTYTVNGASDVMNVNVNSLIVPTFNQMPALCQGSAPLHLPSTSTNGITGVWSPSAVSTLVAGAYTYTFTPNVGQCATASAVTITVIPPQIVPVFMVVPPICTGSPMILPTTSLNGIPGTWSPPFNNSQTMNYTFTPVPGLCALSTVMQVKVVQPTSSLVSVSICPLQLPYIWHGKSLSAAGVYTDLLYTTTGCDSMTTLALNVLVEKIYTDSLTICSSSFPYSWNGKSLSASGIYRDTLKTTGGCDSIRVLELKNSTQWTGTTNNSWEEASNWSCGAPPDAATDVYISSGQVFVNSNTTVRSLHVSSNATITVSPNVVLTILH